MVGKVLKTVAIGSLIGAFVMPKMMNLKMMNGAKKMVTKKMRMLNRTGRTMQKGAAKSFRDLKSMMV